MADKSQYIPLYEKIGYSAADAAANFVFMSMILFQAAFYTDVMKLSAGTAGLIILVPRLWDAFFDPIMGAIADRTRTRWGSFRPWVLWTSLPWGIVMYLAYRTPGFQGAALVAYAVITNTLLMTLYSANNMPYSALGGVMSADINERSKLNSFRFIAVNAAQFIVQGFTLVLVAKFAGPHSLEMPQGDVARGWATTFGLYAVLCVVLFLITFATTRERVKPVVVQTSLKTDLRGLFRNGPWIVMFFMTLVHFGILSFRGGAEYHYYMSYVDKTALYDKLIKPLGLTQELPFFNPAAAGVVDSAANAINLGGDHGLRTGQKVAYTHGGGGTNLGQLVDGNTYYVHVQTDGRFKVYDTREHASAGGNDGLLQLAGPATGSQHELVPASLLESLGYIVHADPGNIESSNVANAAYGLVGMLGKAITIIAIMFAPLLAKRFGKKAIAVVGFALAGVNSLAFYLLGPQSVGLMVVLTITGSLFYAPTIPLLWAMFADVADYSEWKTGQRATGIVFATIGFGLKAGLAIGAYALLGVQALKDYDNHPRSPEMIEAFRVCNTIVPGVLFAICTVLLLVYKLNRRMTLQMADELAQRRSHATGPAGATATS
jgi:Na+/melibiose symporter-like transporter